MIRTNLSTRPFYNEAAVRVFLVVVAAIVAAATIFNVSRVLHYSQNDTEAALQASHDEAAAADLRATASRERASVDAKEIATASTQAHAANDLIDRRTFSWTELFNRFEATLPADVRIRSVRPQLDEKDHRIELAVTVLSRNVDDVNQFIENLEATGAFERLVPVDDRVNEAGQHETALTMKYVPHPEASGQAPPAGSGQGK
jgi:Tfp pilus assembly protein PilN